MFGGALRPQTPFLILVRVALIASKLKVNTKTSLESIVYFRFGNDYGNDSKYLNQSAGRIFSTV